MTDGTSHGESERTVHAQSGGVTVTVTSAVEPVRCAVVDDDDNDTVQRPACCTVRVPPFLEVSLTYTFTLRWLMAAFAERVSVTCACPPASSTPNAGATVTHGASLTVTNGHPAEPVTLTTTVPPSADWRGTDESVVKQAR